MLIVFIPTFNLIAISLRMKILLMRFLPVFNIFNVIDVRVYFLTNFIHRLLFHLFAQKGLCILFFIIIIILVFLHVIIFIFTVLIVMICMIICNVVCLVPTTRCHCSTCIYLILLFIIIIINVIINVIIISSILVFLTLIT